MKRKAGKRLMAAALAAVLSLAVSIPVLAEESDFTLTSEASGKTLRGGDKVQIQFQISEDLSESWDDGEESRLYVQAADEPESEKFYFNGSTTVQGTVTVPERMAYEGSYGMQFVLYGEDVAETGSEPLALEWEDLYFNVQKALEVTDVSFDKDGIQENVPYAFRVTVKNNMDKTLENVRVDCSAPWVVEKYEGTVSYTSENVVTIGAGQTAVVTGTYLLQPGSEAETIQFMARVYMETAPGEEYVIHDVLKQVNIIRDASGSQGSSGSVSGGTGHSAGGAGTSADNAGGKTADDATAVKKASVSSVKDNVPKTGNGDFPAWLIAVAALGAAGLIYGGRKKYIG